MKNYYKYEDLDFNEFLEENSFEDNTGVYNCKLIKVDDLRNFWEYYRNCIIGSNIPNIYECLSMIARNIEGIEEKF